MTVILRHYQSKMVSDVYGAWQDGARNALAVLPTGGGKSIVVSQVALDHDTMGANQCIMAHRTELVSQMSMHIANRGIKHRIIAPTNVVRQVTNDHRAAFGGRSFVNPDARCVVAAAQTLVARHDSLVEWGKQVHNWTVDEAHHLTRDNLWGKAIGLFPNAFGLGVTATPERSDNLGLGRHADGVMDTMILGPQMRELMDEGSLTDYEIAIPQSDFSIDDDAISGSGDYSPKKMRDATKRSHLVGDVVAEYSKRAFGKRAICFATDVESSNEIAALFNDAGIPAASVSAKTDTLLRAEYIRRFREGKIWVLVNVDLFGEGFDVPACEVVIMARPTASLGLYLQMFGRALRPFPGKLYGLIIDHVSNWKRHGFPDRPRAWTLDRREKRAKRERDPEEIELTACRECSRPYERFHPACPYCGWQPDLTPAARRSIEQVDGDLLLLDRDVLAQMRAATVLEAPASVAERVTMAAGPIAGKAAANRSMERHQSQQRLSGAIAQWAAIERSKGRADQQTYRRFFLTTGIDVLTALTGTRQELDALAEKVENWYGHQSAQKKSIEQELIEKAIERGDQDFRGGWLTADSVGELIGLTGNSVVKLLIEMNYIKINNAYKVINNGKLFKVLYHTNSDADPEDFWISNGYVQDHKILISQAIERGDQDFRGGWLTADSVGELTGLTKKAFSKRMLEMNYIRIDTTERVINGNRIHKSLYHTNPDADPEDFWISNGYVQDHKILISQAIERGDQDFRGGWLTADSVGELTGLINRSVVKVLKEMNYIRIKTGKKGINGNKIHKSIYHTDSNADPADFWRLNYEQ